MNRAQMNKFIVENYLKKDKTTFAMMLSGEWGTGKSFYINGELKDFVELWKGNQKNNNENDNNYELIVISLYGMSSLQDLSQRICYERNHMLHNVVKVGGTVVKITAKTLINFISMPQILGDAADKVVDSAGQITDQIIKHIDESIDLTGKLLVFDDVERTKIDIEDLFGYVNNLCEQDKVKVLLVADEKKVKEKFKEKKKSYDDIKDKVVGDTIHFETDLSASIKDISDMLKKQWNIKEFDVFNYKADIGDIKNILPAIPNFRKVIYACQKVHEIFKDESFKKYKDDDQYKQFRKCIFLSALSFIHGGKSSRYLWNEGKIYEYEKDFDKPKEVEKHYALSLTLGDKLYPLPLFVYEYICEQKLKKDSIEICEEKFKFFMEYVSDINNIPSFKVLNFPCKYAESKVDSVLNEAEKYISDANNKINYTILGTLLAHLSFINVELGIDTKKCEDAILKRFFEIKDIFPSEEHIFQFTGGLADKAEEHLNELSEKIMQTFELNRAIIRKEKGNCDIKSFFDGSEIDSKDFEVFIINNEAEKVAEEIKRIPPEFILNVKQAVDDCYHIFISKDNNYSNKWIGKLKESLEKTVENIKDKVVKYDVKLLIKKIEDLMSIDEKDIEEFI